jgi:hypothetical protein
MGEEVFPAAVEKLRGLLGTLRVSPAWAQIVVPRDAVYGRFQPLFAPARLPLLVADEFKPFLYFEHNRHWTGLHRHVNRVTADMPALRQALLTLVDQARPVADRLDEVAGTVRGLGKGTVTAILHVAYPGEYGVWNSTSEAALVELGLFPEAERGESFGRRYARVNDLLVRLGQVLQADLWTLDALWWLAQSGGEPVGGGQPGGIVGPAAAPTLLAAALPAAADHRFGLERHLHDFMFDNWDRLDLGREWAIYGTPGDEETGYEYATKVGRIDILARHRTQKKWLVVELKRAETSDAVVGQTLRYMGWVQRHLAAPGEPVNGLIIARTADAALQYAVAAVPNLAFQAYEVEFRLVEPPPIMSPTTCAPAGGRGGDAL